MRSVKQILCVALAAAALVTSLPIQSIAADYKYITSISLKVDIDLDSGDEVNRGDSLGTNSSDSGNKVYTTSNKYRVVEAEWSNDKELSVGDTPKIIVWLEPDNSGSTEYRFRSSYSSNNVSVSGGTFVSAGKTGGDLKVTLKANGIKGTYDAPEEAEWGNGKGKATWEKGSSSTNYFDVYLYRGNSVVKKLEDYNGTSYNFYPYMTKEGDYSFKVRAVPHTDGEKRYGKKSEWTESDSKYIDEDEVSDGTGQDNGTTASGGTTDVGWRKDGDYWYFRYPDGNYQKAGWLLWNDKWYLFDSQGRMLTGWQQTGNQWYYLGDSGDMKTGWVKSNNLWYYLNPNNGGPEGAMVKNSWLTINGKTYFMNESGAMVEGWYKVENNFYYFYPGDGSKAVNTAVDGFKLDANGIWVH